MEKKETKLYKSSWEPKFSLWKNFWIQNWATYVRWRCMHVLYERLINLQQEVCVTSATSVKTKTTARLESLFSFSKTYRQKLKQAENTSMSTLLTSSRGYHQKTSENFCLTLSQNPKFVKEVVLVFLEISRASGSFWHGLLVWCETFGDS